MRAITISSSGNADVLTPQELPTPKISKDNQVLVRIKAAGLNPIDTKIRAAMEHFPVQNPAILGCDGAGVIEEVGSKVKHFQVGDEVYFSQPPFNGRQGSYAEFCLVDEAFLALKPKSLDFVHAAAAPLVLITAWEALYDRAWLDTDQKVFIHAGGGGVGHVAIQLARIAGADVATTVSTDDKATLVTALGANKVIRYKSENVEQAIKDWSDGEGADIVFDTIGGDAFVQSVACTKVYGQLVTILTPPAEMNWSEARVRNISMTQELMLTPTLMELPEAQQAQGNILKQCARMFDNNKLKVVVANTFKLEEAAEAQRYLEEQRPSGKVVLTID